MGTSEIARLRDWLETMVVSLTRARMQIAQRHSLPDDHPLMSGLAGIRADANKLVAWCEQIGGGARVRDEEAA
jgi:hypothetical protein